MKTINHTEDKTPTFLKITDLLEIANYRFFGGNPLLRITLTNHDEHIFKNTSVVRFNQEIGVIGVGNTRENFNL